MILWRDTNCRLSIVDCRRSWTTSPRWVVGLLLLASFSTPPDARGNIVITLAATNADENPIEDPVAAGTKVFVDVSLSVDEEDDPLLDLRSIQFDFRATTSTIVVSNFRWELPPGVDETSYSRFEALPQPRLVYLSNSRIGNSIIDLDATPVRVATLDVTVNSSGNLDLRNPGADATGGVAIQVGFDEPLDFDLAGRNVTGGTLRLAVEGASGPDTDTPDDRNTGPRATGGLCGGSMVGAMLLAVAGLASLRSGPCRPSVRAGNDAGQSHLNLRNPLGAAGTWVGPAQTALLGSPRPSIPA